MSILQLPTPVTGSPDRPSPLFKYTCFTNSLSEVTAAGFLNSINVQSNPISAGDIIHAFYDYNQQTGVGTYSPFTVSISATGVITLTPWSPTETNVLTHNQIFIGNASNNPLDAPMTGDATIALSGSNAALTIAASAVTTSKINNSAVTFAKVASDVYSQSNFTPTVTFTSPGDLSVIYTTQFGLSIRLFKTVKVIVTISFTPSYTTATGTFQIAGFPLQVDGDIGGVVTSTGLASALTFPTGTTQLNTVALTTSTRGFITALGSAVATAPLTVADIPTGVTQFFNMVFEYSIA